MLGRLIKKIFSRESKEEDVTERKFGNIVTFRIGGLVSVSPTFILMLDDASMFKANFGDTDFSSMMITTILSFNFDNMKVYRLYCANPDCMIQINEEANGTVTQMLFMLTQEIAIQDEAEYGEWYSNPDSIMKNMTITNEHEGTDVNFGKVFGPLNYTETVEADNTGVDRASSLQKSMSLFTNEHDGNIDYMLFDAELDNWVVEGFMGVDVPNEEIQIS